MSQRGSADCARPIERDPGAALEVFLVSCARAALLALRIFGPGRRWREVLWGGLALAVEAHEGVGDLDRVVLGQQCADDVFVASL